MRRPLIGLLTTGLGLTLPAVALAGPPALPEEGEEQPPADGGAGDGGGGDLSSPFGDGSAGGSAEVGGGVEGGASTDAGMDGGAGGEADMGPDEAPAEDLSDPFSGVDNAPAGGDIAVQDQTGGVYDDPGYVEGVRENLANANRGPIGLFNTSLADVGAKYSTRFYLRSDFFVQNRMFVDSPEFGTDRHSRVRGGVGLGFTFTKWTEAYFAVSGSSNRNERDDPNRQDPETVFALGDMDFGVKGAWRGVKGGGIGVGGQVGLGLLSGTDRLLTERVNFNIDALFTADLRYFTAKAIPLRFTANVGWKLDNSYNLVDFGAIDDIDSREVLRFGLGVEHSRVRTRWAIDAPLHLGKRRRIGLDPIIEYAWDISTQREAEFEELTTIAGASPLPRTNQWLTIGLRANPWEGLQLEAAVDVGLVSPNYEFGPPTPPWNVTLGIGWSFDPAMRKPPAPPAPPPPPAAAMDGRIVGTVVDAEGNPLAGVAVTFPGLSTNKILTDDAGRFTSFRFPEGSVQINIELADGSLVNAQADVKPEEDTEIQIQLEGAAPEAVPDSAEWRATITGPDGEGVPFTMVVSGNGVNEPFEGNEAGKIALLLPVGEYSGTVTAPGYKEKVINFTVVAGEVTRIEDTLEKDAPPETPNIKPGKTSIRVRKKIAYKSDQPTDKSQAILDELATFLKFHKQYKLVEVRVYTDDRGNPKKRSQTRADAVRDYLISKGVEADRLVANGKGDSNPVAVNITADGRRKNNRTQFRIKEKAE